MTADKYGRKLAIYVGCIIFFIGSIIQAAAYSLPQMTVGRLVVGFGVGEAAMIVPLYIGEMAPARFRGRLIVFDKIFPRATDRQVDAKARLIRYSIEEATASISNKSLAWQMRQLFTVGQNVRALITACAVMAGR